MINNNRGKRWSSLVNYICVYTYMYTWLEERAVTYVLYKILGQKHKSTQ